MIKTNTDLLEKFGGSPQLLSRVTGAFLSSWERDLDDLNEFLSQDDSTQAARAAHRLKGSIGYFADDNFYKQMVSLEQMTKDGRLGEVRANQDELERKLRDFVGLLTKMQESLS